MVAGGPKAREVLHRRSKTSQAIAPGEICGAAAGWIFALAFQGENLLLLRITGNQFRCYPPTLLLYRWSQECVAGAAVPSGLPLILEDMVADHHPLDLGGAFVDGEDAGIAIVPFDRVLFGIAIAPVDLQGLGCQPVDHFGGK